MTRQTTIAAVCLAAAAMFGVGAGVSFGQGACEVVKLIASNGQTGDRFGYSVAIDGPTAVVGMTTGGGGPDDEYAGLFQRDLDTGIWQEVTVLVDPDSQPGGGFGENVAISGDFVIVTADNAGHNCPQGCSGPGAAYIFQRNQGGINSWGLLVEIEPPDPVCECSFGRSVSIDGDTAIVGASAGPGVVLGQAYIFQQDEGGPNNWGLVTSISPPDPYTTNGKAVAISGDTVVVGTGGQPTYIFERNEGGKNNWGTVGFVDASLNGHEILALDGDTLVVGDWWDNENGYQAGAATIFYRDHGGPGNWGQVVRLFASKPGELDQFGWSVAIDGNLLAVGARGLRPSGGPLLGSINVFHRDEGGQDNWGQVAHLDGGSDTEPDDGIGSSVGLSGETLIFGAPGSGVTGAEFVFQIGGPDCNANVLCDSVEISDGTAADKDGNGVPDECECPAADIDGDGEIGINDFLAVIGTWGPCPEPCPPSCTADVDGDCQVGINDFLIVLGNWGPCL